MGELLFQKTAAPFPVDDLPEVIIDAEADFVDFYNLAWNQAWDHVYESEQIPHSPYLSEGCGINRVWIWDSCFMGMFSRLKIIFQNFTDLSVRDRMFFDWKNLSGFSICFDIQFVLLQN